MRIALVAPDAWTIWLFYRDLVRELTESGAQVTVLSSAGPDLYRLRELRVDHLCVPYARFVAPGRDVQLIWGLRRAFVARRFDVVQNFTIKANLYGALAASSAQVGTIINTVEGAGLLYSDVPGLRIRMLRALAEVGLRRVRERVFRYWFVNAHDRELFVRRRLAVPEKSVVATATGVDTGWFDAGAVSHDAIRALRDELGVPAPTPLISLVAGRMLRSKGVGDFLGMSRQLRAAGTSAQCVLVGPEEPENPDAFPGSILRDAVRDGTVRWLRFREDVRTLQAASEVIVVPTRYAEGTPKGVMEGMAMGRPLVCSDVPAIREMVTDGRDAILVRPGDVGALTSAVEGALRSPSQRAALGREARRTAVTRFDSRRAARMALDLVYSAVPGWPPQAAVRP